ncbi:hypothetical protein OG785_45575 [Streptomyces sp. NBC_00006]|uniref:hypothetical protein n=1 Tax=Streptomyces sp. NBC_00006 TaxID=2975619 RepID=UPI002252BECC|nr:hypothetical protein [Streptomyces sp. NBC_00006]MCX5537831.1 hypothetical protein [Streptomyces sp. NBC_00006]
MNATLTAPAASTGPSVGDETVHLYCCDENRAICGVDLTDMPEVDEDENCVVCIDLEETPCPDCGWESG